MRRYAGDLMNVLAFVNGLGEPVTQGMMAGAAGLPAVAGLYGLVDMFTGPTNGANSGEIPLNLLLTSVLPSAGVAAGALGSAVSKDVRDVVMTASTIGAPPTPEERAIMSRRLEELEALSAEAQRLHPNDAEQGRKHFLRNSYYGRGSRQLAGGMLAGSLAGTLGAMAAMIDAPAASAAQQR